MIRIELARFLVWPSLLVLMLAGCGDDDEGPSMPRDDQGTDAVDGGDDVAIDPSTEPIQDMALDVPEDTQEDPVEDMAPDIVEEVPPDIVEEVPPDMVEEVPPDVVEDPAQDLVVDTEEESDDEPVDCPYPEGPYDFSAVGDVVGPMNWPQAYAGDAETLPADLAVLHCDEGIHSIFIQITSTTCSACPSRLSQIAGLEDHWETYGAKWIFVVNNASSSRTADAEITRRSIDFGWRTNDQDNSLGAGTISYSDIYNAVPWTGVIRTSDMTLVYDEPDTSYLDIEAIAEELASE